ncbi:MAG: hypothetical protein JKX97_09080 [Candidatus Lindowbacteria bacterium]|nr:hypothetical protein [Candidatus Lindowbacteria bacterium]
MSEVVCAKITRFLLFVAGVLCYFICPWNYWSVENTGIWHGAGALFYVLGAALLAGSLSKIDKKNIGLSFYLYFCLNAFVPFYGFFGSVAISLYKRFMPATAGILDEYAEYIQSEAEHKGTIVQLGTVEEQVKQEMEIQSYFDIIKGTDRILKKALIGKIISEWTPNSVQLLKIALLDIDYDVKSYASTALTELENRINKNIISLKEDIIREPNFLAIRLKLARSYLNYSDSGLLDENSSEHYVRMAGFILSDTEDELKIDESSKVSLLLLKAYTARLKNEEEEEEEIYKEVLELDSHNREALLFLCSVQFKEQEFEDLEITATSFLEEATIDHPAVASAKIWASVEKVK